MAVAGLGAAGLAGVACGAGAVSSSSSAHSAAEATMRPEAIDFYNQLAEKWNDEIGWAERRLITNSTSEHGLNR